MPELVYAFYDYCPYCDKKYYCIQQGDKYGTLLESVGEFLCAVRCRQPECYHCKHQAEHVTEVVPCIREQAEGVGP